MFALKENRTTVFVAMSGGVDSSVVAGLMKEQGHEVIGITMCFNIPHPATKKPSCCGVEGIEDAQRAAQILDIPHYVLNFAKEIEENIMDNFTSEYLSGRTPNPCVQCNQHLKFGSLFQKARSLGAEILATGHYAKIEFNKEEERYELKKADDPLKDQSYFLYSVPKDTLPHVWFPLGGLRKSEVRDLARKYRLNTAEKKESQDICFVGEGGYQKFLEDRVGKQMRPGPFVDQEGNVVGQHKGIAYYTIGQRDKLGLALGYPAYVTKIDKETNSVYVGRLDKLYAKGLIASPMNYVGLEGAVRNLAVQARIRYNAPEVTAFLTSLEGSSARIDFEAPQKSVTPGQSVVLYREDVVVGGGIIARAIV